MKTYRSFIVLMLLTVLGLGCKDFIEPSLGKRTVKLLSPGELSETDKYAVNFWWEAVDDALGYRLQIVTPDFDHPVNLITDTLVGNLNRLALTLDPGKYQWRVRAENGSSNSPYSTGSFTIHPSSLKEQKLTVNSPQNGLLTRESNVQLRWDLLFGAKAYRLQIDTLNFANEAKLVYNEALSSNAYLFTFPKDQVYQWRVRAENDVEQSKWSDIRTITYDHTAPARVTAVAPLNGSTVTQPAAMTWNAVVGAKKYKLYVYKADQVTSYATMFPMLLTGLSYSFATGVSGETIYWCVAAIDEAGNEGEQSASWTFIIQ